MYHLQSPHRAEANNVRILSRIVTGFICLAQYVKKMYSLYQMNIAAIPCYCGY